MLYLIILFVIRFKQYNCNCIRNTNYLENKSYHDRFNYTNIYADMKRLRVTWINHVGIIVNGTTEYMISNKLLESSYFQYID